MIKNFGFKNFSSFKDGAHIDFEFDGNTPVQMSKNHRIGNVIGIIGANGSGKTTILKALTFLFCFVSKKMTTRKNQNGTEFISLPIEPFYDSKDPIEFYIELEIEGICFYYELDLLNTGILSEKLIKITEAKECILLKREANIIIENDPLYDEFKQIKLKSDQSLISLVDDYNFHKMMPDIDKIYSFFRNIISNIGLKGRFIKPIETDLISEKSIFYHQNTDAFSFLKQIIMSSDDAIENIKIEVSKNEMGKDIYYPVFMHQVEQKLLPLTLYQESMGTQTLFSELFKYWFALKLGATLVYDEFDTHLHAFILPEIVKLFKNKKLNPKNAQLIVTAHNTEILDELTRYGSILVEKHKNISFCYRLDEINQLGNDKPISPAYRKSLIGGVPNNIRELVDRLSNQVPTT